MDSVSNDKDSIYHYGFIYIDAQAGLTLHYERRRVQNWWKGSFTKLTQIKEGCCICENSIATNKIAIAVLPEEKFSDLNIQISGMLRLQSWWRFCLQIVSLVLCTITGMKLKSIDFS
jgi:hypothetical protein